MLKTLQIRVIFALSLFLLCVGCDDTSGPQTYPVTGTVTFKGQLLKEGQISFRPDEKKGGSGPMHVADIVNGEYSGETTEGPKRVEIYGEWDVPGKFIVSDDGSGKKFPVKESLPAKYNEGSQLEATISASSDNEMNFDLK